MLPLARQARPLEDLVVEVDVVDVERDVLLGFPVDRLGQLGLAHHRQADALDDHGVTRQRGRDRRRGLDPAALEQPLDRLRDQLGVHDRAVDDRLRGQRLPAELRDLVARGPCPSSFSSTTLIELSPMSNPTRLRLRPNSIASSPPHPEPPPLARHAAQPKASFPSVSQAKTTPGPASQLVDLPQRNARRRPPTRRLLTWSDHVSAGVRVVMDLPGSSRGREYRGAIAEGKPTDGGPCMRGSPKRKGNRRDRASP